MSERDDALLRLADLVGLADHYLDQHGERVDLGNASRRSILNALGFPAASGEGLASSLRRIETLRQGLLPPLVVLVPDEPGSVALRRKGGGPLTWTLTDEAGAARDGVCENSHLELPALEAGYYTLRASEGGGQAQSTLIVAPRSCWQPGGDERFWGAAAQVYGLRSERNLGVGDYSDIADAAAGTAGQGADFLGLSPLHALFSSDRTKYSPYSPSSRLFLETLFLDPEKISGFSGSSVEALAQAPDFQERKAALQDGPLIDYAGVWELKRPLLEGLWRIFRDSADADAQAAFAAFRAERGEPLELHATFEALSEHFSEEGRHWVGEWPHDFRDCRSDVVRFFREERAERVSFHAWLQWQADLQLAEAARRAREAGMAIGLYRDLAVGADRAGSEVWAAPEHYALNLSVGAPPDPLGPLGQDWGLPPFDPVMLEQQGLAAFRAVVAANMRHAGAIRIDHAFQLQRLFLIPPGGTGADGAYVRYPFEAMLAVLRLESHRACCAVIAEDLGTAPPGFSEAIMASGVLSYRVLFFERGEGGRFQRPDEYPPEALAVFTTHDLPTFRGWWRGLDIDLRQTLGLFDPETADAARATRRDDVRAFAQALHDEGLLPTPDAPDEPPLEACVRYLGRTRSRLTGVQLEDAAGELNQANLPGPDNGHPNWRRRLSVPLAELVGPGGDLARLGASLKEEGRGHGPGAGGLAAAPRATYRLQFHKDFSFDDAVRIVPYLAALGVSHLYSSPIHQARPGSAHGYDIVNHAVINPELGGEEGFIRLSDTLKEHGLGLILDIVPNHMGVGGSDNAAWLSVLEWGELSPAAIAFDVDWERAGANRKLVVPVLGERYGDALEAGNLKLVFDPAEGSFSVWHFEHRLPICPLAYPAILERAVATLDPTEASGRAELLAVGETLRQMREETAPERLAALPGEAEALKRRLAALVKSDPAAAEAIERAVSIVNGVPGNADSFGALHRLLDAQSWRAAYWRVAESDINYRRFFDINSLAGLRMEEPAVFARAHETIVRLVQEDRIQGLRVDHVDGLADPEAYIAALQAAVGPGFYIIAEKILEPGEKLRPWALAGTTGYDALNLIDGIFVNTQNGVVFERLYRDFSDLEGGYGRLLREAKAELLGTSFASELEALVSDLNRIADSDRRTRDYTANALRRALAEIIARFPVYRTYIREGEAVSPEDRALVESTVAQAMRWSALADRSVHLFTQSVLLGEVDTAAPGQPDPEITGRFRRRFQQLTGPVMAKSLEDTLFYRYQRLIALNEVGGDPDHFGVGAEAFHAANAARLEDWPDAMIATATHDTKRGEDARARLLALSDLAEDWAAAIARWREIAEPLAQDGPNGPMPDANDQFMLLQALLAAWPLELLDADDAEALEAFSARAKAYAEKALREAKRHSSWVNPDDDYETATAEFIAALLAPDSAFLRAFRPLAQLLSKLGMVNSLSRTALKLTLPGVPDFYQGTEFWDFSFVDPDNRRPVDYAARQAALEGAEGSDKQRLVAALLADRAEAPLLYARGSYEPLAAGGEHADALIAFRRVLDGDELVVAAPRFPARVEQGWGDTALTFSGLALSGTRWRNVASGEEFSVEGESVLAAKLFSAFPVAVLRKVS